MSTTRSLATTMILLLLISNLWAGNSDKLKSPASGDTDNSVINYDLSSSTFLRLSESSNISTEQFLNLHLEELGKGLKPENFKLISKETDDLGMIHYRYQQQYNGVPLDNIQVIFHEKSGRLQTISGAAVKGLEIETEPGIAIENARALMHEKLTSEFPDVRDITVVDNLTDVSIAKTDEVLRSFAGNHYHLAYTFLVEIGSKLFAIKVNAQNGEIVRMEAREHNCSPTVGSFNNHPLPPFTGIYNINTNHVGGGTYELYDPCRNIQTGSNYTSPSTNGSLNWNALNDEAALHHAGSMVHDYLDMELGRNGFDDLGDIMIQEIQPMFSGARFVHGLYPTTTYCKFGYTTAGEPIIALDVVGHEWTHAMNTRNAQLTFSHESGALNEGFADIFGTMVEQFVGVSADWTIGEDIPSFGPIRDMCNPPAHGQPDTYGGTNWIADTPRSAYCSYADHYFDIDHNIHNNSGVLNKWFCLLSNGGTHNSISVPGITATMAQMVAYRAMNYYLFPFALYSDTRIATVQAAGDLFGICSPEQNSTQLAWDAVMVPMTTNEHFKLYAYLEKGICNGPQAEGSVDAMSVGSYSFNWSTGSTSQYNVALNSGTNTVTVTETGSGCSSTAQIEVHPPQHYPKATSNTAYGDSAKGIDSDDNGNSYMVGSFGSSTHLGSTEINVGGVNNGYDNGSCTSPAAPYDGGYLVKLDQCGNVVWRIQSQWVLSSPVNWEPIVSFNDVTLDEDGFIYVIGTMKIGGGSNPAHCMILFNGTAYSEYGGHPSEYFIHPPNQHTSMFLMKIQPNGIIDWVRHDYSVINANPKTICTGQSEIYVAGDMNNKAFIMKAQESDGEEDFNNFPILFSGSANSTINDIDQDPVHHNLYIIGTMEAGTMTYSLNSLSSTTTDAFIDKIDPGATSLIWSQQGFALPPSWTTGEEVELIDDPQGQEPRVFICGSYHEDNIQSPFDYTSAIWTSSSTTSNAYMFELDNMMSGAAINFLTLDESFSSFTGITGLNLKATDQNIYISGQVKGDVVAFTPPGPVTGSNLSTTTNKDVWVAKTDLSLSPDWINIYWASEELTTNDITHNQRDVISIGEFENNISTNPSIPNYVNGICNSSPITCLSPTNRLAYAVRNQDPTGDAYKRSPSSESQESVDNSELNEPISLYPNPTNSDVTISFKEKATGVITVVDIYGRALITKNLKESNMVNLNLSEFPSGMYLIDISANGNHELRRIIKQ